MADTDSVLTTFATGVAHKAQGPVKTFDPMLIMVVVQIAVAIYQACKKNPPSSRQIQDPGVLEKWALRHATKKVCGREVFRLYGREIMTAMLQNAAVLSEDDAVKLIAEIGGRVSLDEDDFA